MSEAAVWDRAGPVDCMLGADAVPMRNVRSVIEAKTAHENLGGGRKRTLFRRRPSSWMSISISGKRCIAVQAVRFAV